MTTITLRIAICIVLLLVSAAATAGGEKIWELAGHNEFSRGELQQTILSSRGDITRGLGQEKIDLEAIGLVWTAVQHTDGTTYLGTGYDGKIFRVDGNKAHLIATTGTLLVTDMLFDNDGALLVSTLPESTIWKIAEPQKIDPANPVKAKLFATLGKDEQIWTLARDAKKKHPICRDRSRRKNLGHRKRCKT